MSCHYQLARSPAPPPPPRANAGDRRGLRDDVVGWPAVAKERSHTQGVVALAMFTLWMVILPWLLAREIFTVALAHTHVREYAGDPVRAARGADPRGRESRHRI